jgi:excisionase family DNA binding protein
MEEGVISEESFLLTTGEAAEILGVTADRLAFYVRSGLLPATRERRHWAYRIERKDVDSFLLAHRHEPGSWPSLRRKPDGREWIEALTAAGWSDGRICNETGMSEKALRRSREHGVGSLYRQRVRSLAERLLER